MCQLGPNLPIASEDRIKTKLFDMTLVTLKIRERSPKPNNHLISVPVWSKSSHWFRKVFFIDSYMSLVTLKIKSRSPKI